ncbi:MAG: HTH domain-containing protein [Candidatus Moranbacteria bacterium]|nr:HTH domain-containing protein [Candidatus Moranbacteria bacterium]
MKTSERIINYIISHDQATGKELADFLGVTDRAVRKQLKSMLEKGELTKSGKPPLVYYSLNKEKKRLKISADDLAVNKKAREIIDRNFLYISPRGKRLEGWAGFSEWCARRSYDPIKKSEEYLKTYNKYESFRKDGYISGKRKMKSTFPQNLCLEDVFYSDFYSWEIFGKTKLGQLLLYAKQNQNKSMMKEIISKVDPIIEKIIKKYDISAIGYIPPSVKRDAIYEGVSKVA